MRAVLASIFLEYDAQFIWEISIGPVRVEFEFFNAGLGSCELRKSFWVSVREN